MISQEAFEFDRPPSETTGVRLRELSHPLNVGTGGPAVGPPSAPAGPPVRPDRLLPADDEHDDFVRLWLFGKSPRTVDAYVRTIGDLRAFVCGASLRALTLGDLQAYMGTLTIAHNSCRTAMFAIKSFYTFAYKTGYLRHNVALLLKTEKARETVQDRILTKDHVATMLDAARGRDALYVRFLYASALRVSESVSIRWSDFAAVDRGEAVVTVLGKGSKTRTVRIDAGTWSALCDYRAGAPGSARVWPFGAPYARKRVRLIRGRAKLEPAASPHWFRHAHASHYIEAGGQIDVLQRVLGHATMQSTSVYLHARPRECSARSLDLLK